MLYLSASKARKVLTGHPLSLTGKAEQVLTGNTLGVDQDQRRISRCSSTLSVQYLEMEDSGSDYSVSGV